MIINTIYIFTMKLGLGYMCFFLTAVLSPLYLLGHGCQLRQLAHLSSFHYELSDRELIELARDLQVNDQLANLTGLLIYREGCMFSIVEGPEEVVTLYYQNIRTDSLQHSIITVFDKYIQHRDFTFLNFAFKSYAFSKTLSLKLNADEEKHCSQEQINEFENLVDRARFQDVDVPMSAQISNLIKTFQRTILRYDAPQHERNVSNIWSRPTLSRSNTSE